MKNRAPDDKCKTKGKSKLSPESIVILRKVAEKYKQLEYVIYNLNMKLQTIQLKSFIHLLLNFLCVSIMLGTGIMP